MLIDILLTALVCATAILGDVFVQKFENRQLLEALIDNGTHAIVGGVIWCIVCLQRKIIPSSEIIWQVLLCTFVASAIDVDHFIEAKSLKLQDIRLLTGRPFLHCTSLAAGAALILIFLSYLCSWERLHIIGWIIFAAFISHHTRDATRRGYWLCPLGSTVPLYYWVYISITAALPYLIAICYGISKPEKPLRKITYIGEYSML